MDSESRSLKLLIKNKYIDFPITAKGIFLKLGIKFGLKAFLSFLWERFISLFEKKNIEEFQTFEKWAIKNYGKHIYKTFFGPYTEKVWNIPCDELSADIIPPHTRKNHVNRFRQSLSIKLNNNELKNVKRDVTGTYYPKSGFGEIPEKLAAVALENGAEIKTSAIVNAVHKNDDGSFSVKYMEGNKNKNIKANYVISTITPKKFINMIHPSPPENVITSANQLETLALLVLGMVTSKQRILNDSGIYLTDSIFNRLTETNEFNVETTPEGLNILVAEIPCTLGGDIWNMSAEDLFEKCIISLSEKNILKREEVVDLLLNKAPDAYSIFKKDYVKPKEVVMNYIQDQPNIHLLGRTGEFVYRDTDMCMRAAFDLADRFKNKTIQ